MYDHVRGKDIQAMLPYPTINLVVLITLVMTLIPDHGHVPCIAWENFCMMRNSRLCLAAHLRGKSILIWVALESLEEAVKTILCSVSIDCSLKAILEHTAVMLDQDWPSLVFVRIKWLKYLR